MHTYGLLSGSFRPEGEIRRLGSYLRQRAMLVEYASHHIQHMQKALTQMNLKLQHVISDITGKTGMKIIEAIVGGERNPRRLAQLRDPRTRANEATIARSLQGHWREEHIFELTQALELYRTYQDKIAQCDREIEKPGPGFPGAVPGTAPTAGNPGGVQNGYGDGRPAWDLLLGRGHSGSGKNARQRRGLLGGPQRGAVIRRYRGDEPVPLIGNETAPPSVCLLVSGIGWSLLEESGSSAANMGSTPTNPCLLRPGFLRECRPRSQEIGR